VHSCPNYTVPYEPHLNIPVLKFWPGFSKQIFKKIIKEHIDVWQSLNFISCKDVKKIAQQNNLIAIFSSGVMYKAFNRLDVDMVYADRQSGSFIQLLWRFFKLVHIDWVLKWMPASISTPMIFTLRKV